MILTDISMFLQIFGTTLVIFGVYYITIPKIKGQYLMSFAQIVWFSYAMFANTPALAVQSIILFIFSLKAIKSWRKKNIT